MLLIGVLLGMAAVGALTPLVVKRLGSATGYFLAAAFAIAALLLLTALPGIVAGDYPSVAVPWIPSLGVEFALRMDALSLIFAELVLVVGSLIMVYCTYYLNEKRSHSRLYFLLTSFAVAMLLLVLADDLILLLVGWELTSLISFLLIGGQGTSGAQSAVRAIVVTVGGGLGLFAAAVILIVATGTSNISEILTSPEVAQTPLGLLAAGLIVLAAVTKSGQFPFHFWLPGAMVALTPVSAYLHAATMVKAGVYLLMLFTPLFAGTVVWHALIVIGLVTAVIGALIALKQHDLKALLAYSTVSQLGFIIALIGVGTPLALVAAILWTVAHALFKATLFMLVGIVDKQAGSRDIRRLEGLRKTMPRTAFLTALAAMSMAGLPPMLGFISKEAMYDTFLYMPGPPWVRVTTVTVALFAATLTFAYGARLVYGAFGGTGSQPRLSEPHRGAMLSTLIPALAGLLLGLGIGIFYPLVARALTDVVADPDPETQVGLWHGLTAPLGLTVLTVALGTTLFLARQHVDSLLQRARLPFTGAGIFDRVFDATIALGRVIAAPSMKSSAATQIAPLLVVLAAGATIAWADGSLGSPGELRAPAADWIVGGLIALAAAGLVSVRSRLAAIALLGVIGFAVALFFMFAGAPDLVLTQILIEILTVVAAVLVLQRLPERFPRITVSRSIWSGALAIAVGLAAAVATLTLTTQPGISDTGRYVLREAQEQTGGANAVNVVLVDFRAFDTLGEITILAMAAIGLTGLLYISRTEQNERPPPAILRVAMRIFEPTLLLIAAYLLLRGHSAPGGGFIAALVVSCAVALRYLTQGLDGLQRTPFLRPIPMVASGLLLAAVTGVGALVAGAPFLSGAHGSVPLPLLGEISLTTALIFDLGVLLVVVGLVVAALSRLGARP